MNNYKILFVVVMIASASAFLYSSERLEQEVTTKHTQLAQEEEKDIRKILLGANGTPTTHPIFIEIAIAALNENWLWVNKGRVIEFIEKSRYKNTISKIESAIDENKN